MPFGTNISTDVIGDIIITPEAKYFKDFLDKDLKVTIKPVPFVAQHYKLNVVISFILLQLSVY